MDISLFKSYFSNLEKCLDTTEITGITNRELSFDSAATILFSICKTNKPNGKLIFIGNGGSAAIASHMALDWNKAGGVRATALNDPVALTAYGNDCGFNHVFSGQLYNNLNVQDILIAISSSGESKDILNAVEYADAYVVTFSGFSPLNTLRKKGHLNFYVPSHQYGFVEVAHLTILHALLDIYNGTWK